jgi:hypothetical protein
MTTPPTDPDRTCENCGRWVDQRELLFNVRLQIMAEKTLDLTPAATNDLENSTESLQELIEALSCYTDEQVQEATDQVHEEFRFNLCPQCRHTLHQRIKQRRNLLF